MGARQIKGDSASVRCENSQVIINGTIVNGATGATAPQITVGTVEPATPAAGDLWIDTDN